MIWNVPDPAFEPSFIHGTESDERSRVNNRPDNETPVTDLISDERNLILLKVYTDLNLNR